MSASLTVSIPIGSLEMSLRAEMAALLRRFAAGERTVVGARLEQVATAFEKAGISRTHCTGAI